MFNKKKGIIFDFDGVIVDSLDIKTKAFYELYKQYGKNIATKVQNHHLKNSGISRYNKFKIYHNKFLNKNITNNEINQLSEDFSQLVLNKILKASLIFGIKKFLDSYKNNFLFFISSATPQKELEFILEKKKIIKYFISIYGSPTSKTSHIKKILFNFSLNNKELLFVGDGLSDYKAAKKYQIDFILKQHKYNLELFKDYKCVKIKNFYKFYNTIINI